MSAKKATKPVDGKVARSSPAKPNAAEKSAAKSGRRLVIVDGHGIIFRSYFGMPEPLNVPSTGEVVTVAFGFANTLLSVLNELKPTHVAIALDPPGPTFRHEKDDSYKAHREKAPEDLVEQLPRVRGMIETFNFPIYMEDGFEADDVLGTLARQADEDGVETYLVTLDSDIVQLVGGHVKVYMIRPYQRDTVVYDADAVRDRYGIDPGQMADLKGLMGDTSDNVPGVPGVGEKTALKLIEQFGSIENIYASLDDVTPEKLREKLRENEDSARHSKEMVTIHTEVPVELDLDACSMDRFDTAATNALFKELAFRSLLPRLPGADALADLDDAAAVAAAEGTDYQTIYTTAELNALVKQLKAAKSFAFDTETTSVQALNTTLVGISVAWAEGKAAYVPVSHLPQLGDKTQLPLDVVLEKLGPLFENEKIAKAAHNAKFDMEVLGGCGIEVRGVTSDTMIAAYLLGEGGAEGMRAGGGLGLKWLASKRLGIEMTPISDLIGKGAKQVTMAEVAVEQAAPYASADADMTRRLQPLLERELKEQDLWPLYTEMEMPLVPVLMRMEQAGVAVDSAALREMSQRLGEQVEALEKDAYEAVGHEFNLGSPQQLSQLFFEELGLPKTRRTKQGYTTDATALEGLRGAHDVIDVLLEWRQLTKLKSTYVDALPALVHPRTGRIHSNFNQTVAATGRLSSQDPNLQNIPVRTELGNAIRRCFIARDFGPKPLLLAADYSQIELRILAHLSQDPGLLASFHNDEDVHAATASQVFAVPLDKVTPDQRRRAKVFNFGVLYGLGEYGLSTREGISREEAAAFIETYFEKYPKVKAWRDTVIESCRERGYAETIAGRRRRIPEIGSSNHQARSAAERMAVNMPVQGAASDIIKIAMNKIDAELRERRLTTKMILQVHDELIFEGPQKERDDVQEMVLRIMPQSLELDVPLNVDLKAGHNWGELEGVGALAR